MSYIADFYVFTKRNIKYNYDLYLEDDMIIIGQKVFLVKSITKHADSFIKRKLIKTWINTGYLNRFIDEIDKMIHV